MKAIFPLQNIKLALSFYTRLPIATNTLDYTQLPHPVVNYVSVIRSRAEYLYQSGVGIADAAHVAYAEVLADVFITCDDKLLKKCQKETSLKITAMNPLQFVLSEELQ